MPRIKELSKYFFILTLLFHAVSKSSEINFSSRFFHDWSKAGLTERTIWEINKDNSGKLWFATNKGMFFYDGYQFTLVQSAKPTLTNSIVRSFEILRDGSIWLGTYDGLAKLTIDSKYYSQVNLTTEKGVKLNLKIYNISHSNGRLWLSTSDGLYIYNIKSDIAQKVLLNFTGELKSRIKDIIQIEDVTYIAYENKLLKLNSSGEFIAEFSIKIGKGGFIRINKLFYTEMEQLLLGTTNGLYRLDSINNDLVKIELTKNDLNIISFSETAKNEIYAGTLYDGLYKLKKNRIIAKYRYQKSNPFSLSDNDIYSLFIDKNILWVGTFNGGLNQYNLSMQQYGLLNDKVGSIDCLDSPVVYSSLKIDDILYLATQNGLVSFDLKNLQCKSFSHRLNKTEIISLLLIDNNTLLLGTEKGLLEFNISNHNLRNLSPVLENKPIYSILNDRSGNLWIGTPKGMYVRELNSRDFHKIQSSNKKIENAWIFKILQSNSGRLLASSWVGLLEIKNREIIQLSENEFKLTVNKPVRAFNIDSNDNVWFGIDYLGLYSTDLDGNLKRKYTEPETVQNISGFLDVYSDQFENVWVAGKAGIDLIKPNTNRVYNLKQADGLQSDIFTINSINNTNDNKLIFSGRKGLNIIDPKSFSPNLRVPKVIITKFSYLDKNNTSKDATKLITSSSYLLDYSNRDIEIQFSSLDFEDPHRNKYAYKMIGWNNQWVFTNSENRRAIYNNLPAGDYIFRVKASNNHGVWNKIPTELQITILPAPWQTWWAYTIYSVLVILTTLSFIRYRTRSLEKRSIQLEKSVKQRTTELAAEKTKVEQLLSRKNEEFANISHEFRTPLTLILGPLDQVIQSGKETTNVNRLKVIQRNSYRLLRMVDQLLNLETFRVKSIAQRSTVAIGKTIRLIAEAFFDLADEENIKLCIEEIENINFEFTHDAIEKIVLNLLSNAIKYSKKISGEICISAVREDNSYVIKIKDNGVGIPKDKIEKIFDRYSRVLNENSEQIPGAGIGLALVKSLVESHSGRISVVSEVGVGSSFTVHLPIVNEVMDSDISATSHHEIIDMEIRSLTSQEIDRSGLSKTSSNLDRSGKPILLIIEDNSDMRLFICESLIEDYEILTAKNGSEGVARAVDQVPDLIISDIMMPKVDGYQTTRLLRENDITNHIPIILLTARGDRISRLRGWKEKADEYITKPFDLDELKLRISNLLAIRIILKRRFSENLFHPEVSEMDTVDKIEGRSNSDDNAQNIAQPDLSLVQQKFVNKLNEYIEIHYSETDFSSQELASHIAMSERQLFRKLRSVLDMTPADYLRRFRLEKAKTVLIDGRAISYVSADVGFSSQSYFSKCFKAQFGITPSEYQKHNRSQ